MINTPLRARTPVVPRDEIADILNNLKGLHLGAQPVLGDRTNVQAAIRQAQQGDSLKGKARQPPQVVAANPLVISSGSEGESPAPLRYKAPKAVRLNQLADKASSAAENIALASLVKEFVQVLQMNSSRTMTKEAFYFLDVLYKQLDDPSVFIKPAR